MESFILFINSNSFVALTTILAGTTALIVYLKQKADYKRDASKTLYSEITNAERVVKEVKKIKQNNNLLSLGNDAGKYSLGDSSWERLKYLFVNNFDSNEWEKLNTFFNQRDEYTKTITNISNLFPKNLELRMQSIQCELAKIATEQAEEWSKIKVPADTTDKKYTEKTKGIIEKYENKATAFKTIFIDANTSFRYSYLPQGTFEPLEKVVDIIDTDLSISSIGLKIKKMGK
ncbi:MAG: hypothetical protein UR45_C0027G0009 [candidate division WS6 bacterium GW2011_WS6_33_547]|nr:MAG: hypothetical protein UR45_C0027G0009 [candidate division WS6 bacterium GW2011_WS6_33_547]HBB65019.1 hypothetical protein [Patescibacteria group bacterium]